MPLEVGTVASLGVNSADVRAFYKQNWKRPTILSDEAFYAWQFEACPDSVSDDLVIALDRDAGSVAGALGLNAHRFDLSGHSVAGAELTTWIVADAYRSTGVGLTMLDHAMKSFDVLIAMGISAFSLPVFLRSGFRYLKAIPRFVRPFNMDVVAALGSADPLARKLNVKWTATPPEADYTVDANTDADAWRLFASSHSGYARDANHLSWRYANHPFFHYETFRVRCEGGEAVVALRIEESVQNARILHVLDVFGEDKAVGAAFDFIDRFAREREIDVADFYCTCAGINKHPLSRGWFSVMDDDHLRFPHLFHPVEVRQPATTSLAYWSRDHLVDMCDFSRLYITKADADFDRPVPRNQER